MKRDEGSVFEAVVVGGWSVRILVEKNPQAASGPAWRAPRPLQAKKSNRSRKAPRALGQRGVLEDRYNLLARHSGIIEEEIIYRVTSFDVVQ